MFFVHIQNAAEIADPITLTDMYFVYIQNSAEIVRMKRNNPENSGLFVDKYMHVSARTYMSK